MFDLIKQIKVNLLYVVFSIKMVLVKFIIQYLCIVYYILCFYMCSWISNLLFFVYDINYLMII